MIVRPSRVYPSKFGRPEKIPCSDCKKKKSRGVPRLFVVRDKIAGFRSGSERKEIG